jgi:hypothetical protein
MLCFAEDSPASAWQEACGIRRLVKSVFWRRPTDRGLPTRVRTRSGLSSGLIGKVRPRSKRRVKQGANNGPSSHEMILEQEVHYDYTRTDE